MTAARTASGDQHQAAVTDARRRLEEFAATHATRPHADATGIAAWLDRQVADLNAAVTARTARTCPHIGPSPTVLHAALWDRWRLVCTRCLPALLPTDPAEENLCDRCGHHAPLIHPGSATAGPVILAFGLCTPCAQSDPTSAT